MRNASYWKNKHFKAVLFDADGTLYDNHALHYQASKQAIAEFSDFEITEELYHTEMTYRNRKTVEVLKEQGVVIDKEEFYEAKKRHYSQLLEQGFLPLRGLQDFLKALQTHNLPCVIVSGGTRVIIEMALKGAGIYDYFESIISADITAQSKPHPLPYLMALERLNLHADDCVAFEDTVVGITSARAAGIACIGVRNSVNRDDDLASADGMIKDFSHLKYSFDRKAVSLTPFAV